MYYIIKGNMYIIEDNICIIEGNIYIIEGESWVRRVFSRFEYYSIFSSNGCFSFFGDYSIGKILLNRKGKEFFVLYVIIVYR